METPFYMPPIDIIILSLDRADKTIKCLDSVYKKTKKYNDIIIIDNGSKEEECQKIIEYIYNQDNTYLYIMDENLGVVGGRKAGLEHSEVPYVIFLDNDMVVERGWLRNLWHTMKKDKDIMAVCARVMQDGKTVLNGRDIKDGKIDYSIPHLEKYCDLIHGGATLYKKAAFDKAKLDDNYFVGFEDLDFFMQLREKGYKLSNCIGAVVCHHPTHDGKYSKLRRNPVFINKSRNRFKQKWGMDA